MLAIDLVNGKRLPIPSIAPNLLWAADSDRELLWTADKSTGKVSLYRLQWKHQVDRLWQGVAPPSKRLIGAIAAFRAGHLIPPPKPGQRFTVFAQRMEERAETALPMADDWADLDSPLYLIIRSIPITVMDPPALQPDRH